MENKLTYKIQTALLIIYIGVIPLLYKKDPQEFHNVKLLVMYLLIASFFVVALFTMGSYSEKFKLAIKTYKLERRLFILAIIFMFLSLFNNILEMSSYVKAGYIGSPVFYGAGPNYLSIFFYWGLIMLFFTLVPVWHYVKKDWVKYAAMGSLIIVGLLIAYQVFINDFVGVARSYLFGFGNSNYVPDPFALAGLVLVIPFLFSKKINWIETVIGIFMFFIVLLSLSRAAFMGLGVSVLFTLIYLAVTKRLELKRTLLLAVAGVVVLTGAILVLNAAGDSGIFSDFQSLFNLFTGESDLAGISSMRTDLWKATIDYMNAKPVIWFLGNGQSVYIWNAETTSYLVTNVHNMYLDVLFSGGLIVFGVFMTLLVKQYIYAFKLAKYDVKNVVLLSGLVFISVKWLFNSLNAVHSPFIVLLLIVLNYRYMEYKNIEVE